MQSSEIRIRSLLVQMGKLRLELEIKDRRVSTGGMYVPMKLNPEL